MGSTLGVFPRMADPDSPLSKVDIAQRVTSDDKAVAFQAFAEVLDDISTGRSDPALANPEISTSIWQEVVATADNHYVPASSPPSPATNGPRTRASRTFIGW